MSKKTFEQSLESIGVDHEDQVAKGIQSRENSILKSRTSKGDLPGSPVAKILHSQCKEPGFHLRLGNYIPHAATKTQHSQINKYFLKRKKFKRTVCVWVRDGWVVSNWENVSYFLTLNYFPPTQVLTFQKIFKINVKRNLQTSVADRTLD